MGQKSRGKHGSTAAETVEAQSFQRISQTFFCSWKRGQGEVQPSESDPM